MRIKYWGKPYESSLSLTADLFDNDMNLIHSGFPMTEVNSFNYKTDNVFGTIALLSPGIYVTRIMDSVTGDCLGHDEFIFNGQKVLSLLDIQFLTDTEKMQLRDAIGMDGNKMIARGGQLQKKSESPYNETIDTNKIQH